MNPISLPHRPRRNRASDAIRTLVRETVLLPGQFVYPIFMEAGVNKRTPVKSMPGIDRISADLLPAEIEACLNLGISSFMLFPAVPDELKDTTATYSWNPENFYLKAIRDLKSRFPQICLISDVAMDPYSSDGHDGFVQNGSILNDETLPILAKMSLAQAEAGIDLLGPSDMMDGRVGYLRKALDDAGYTGTGIMSYTAKYASAFYGPFRDALDSAPKSGDKKTYQMDFANRREALREAELDAAEGADILMVKPALSYLDVIAAVRHQSLLPVAAYNVSGEYAMIKAAAQNGWIDGEKAMVEVLMSIHRAGADIVISYFAKEYATWYAKNR
jgi:porphobilinogen synthase